MDRTALVLGASGGFGGQVALALQTAGWQVRRYSRGTDMARAAVGLATLGDALPAYADIPFAGHAFTINDLAARVARLTGRPMQIVQFPLWFFTALSPVWELARELREMLYLNRHPHWLDPDPLRHWLPGFQDTPLDAVILAHLQALRLV